MSARPLPGLRPIALVGAGIGIWLLFQQAGLDKDITGRFFDPVANVFPLREAWWLRVAGHTALKWTMLAFWLACLFVGGAYRRGALYMAAIAVIVNFLRATSPYSCPWDLQAFGGSHPLAGHCLPAAHPLTGFALLGLYRALIPAQPRAARAAFWAAWLIGFGAGAVQVARGAHFASHVLWTAWISCVVALALPQGSAQNGQPHNGARD